MSVDAAPLVLTAGSVFRGRYEVVRCIAAGGMGAVYEVVDQATRRRRALKVMLPSVVSDPDLRARFCLEATVTADIDSKHIVETFDAGVDDATGAPFLVMELLRGHDLGHEIETRGALPAAEVIVHLRQAALALDRTHAAGVVHRDLKPENLFLTQTDDGSPHLKVLDFGIAKVVAQSGQGAKTTRAMGSPLYMSPEQIEGDGALGPRSDLYALGHIAHTLLTGEPYWTADAHTLPKLLLSIMRGAQEPATTRAQRRGVVLPAEFDAWFVRATAVLPADRFGAASELVDALVTVLDGAVPVPVPAAGPLSLGEAPTVPSDALAHSATLASDRGSKLGAAPAVTPPGGSMTAVVESDVRGSIPVARSLWPVALGVIALAVLGVGAAIGLQPKSSEGNGANAIASSAPSTAASAKSTAAPSVAAPVPEVTPVSSPVTTTPSARAPSPAAKTRPDGGDLGAKTHPVPPPAAHPPSVDPTDLR